MCQVEPKQSTPPKTRIQLIDAVRGLSILLMVAYHTGYDLWVFGLIPKETLYNPLLNTLEPLFAGVFILLSGVSARYARDNRGRGLRVLACALLVSLVTGFFGAPVTFGILHCLGLCMVITGDPSAWLNKIPRRVQPFLFGGLFVLSFLFVRENILRLNLTDNTLFDGVPYLYMFGLFGPNFQSVDYFPLLPWFFLYPLGAWLGLYIKEGRLPRRFYTLKVPVLPAVGRHTLVIYMLHQPVIYFAVMGLAGMLGT